MEKVTCQLLLMQWNLLEMKFLSLTGRKKEFSGIAKGWSGQTQLIYCNRTVIL